MNTHRIAMILILSLALMSVGVLTGCQPVARPETGDPSGDGAGEMPVLAWRAGAFAPGQVLRYDVLVTVDGRSGTGSLTITVSMGGGSGELTVAYEGHGPGIAGSPIYDGHEFSGLATLTDLNQWHAGLVDSLDGSSRPLTGPLLLAWDEFFAGQPSWSAGATWQAADGSTVSFTEEQTFAGVNGMAGEITGTTTASFCVAQDVPLPLYAKVTDNGVTLEYTLVEVEGY